MGENFAICSLGVGFSCFNVGVQPGRLLVLFCFTFQLRREREGNGGGGNNEGYVGSTYDP